MTQTSYLVGENRTNPLYTNPAHDCGPYSSLEWRRRQRVLFAGDRYDGDGVPADSVGPFASFLNRLAVTTAGGDIYIDSGACFVDGNVLVNDADTGDPDEVVISPTHPVAPDEYTVVAVLNDTNAAYNTDLDVPAANADYDLLASIPAYSCRLAIFRGSPAAIIQTPATIFTVPLYTFDIDAAGAVTNITDIRSYVDGEVKTMWVSPGGGRDTSVAADIIPGGGADGDDYYAELPDGNTARAVGTFIVPQDFIQDMEATAVVLALASGDVAVDNLATKVRYSQCGEAFATNTDTLAGGAGVTTYALTAGERECIAPLVMDTATIGDMAIIQFTRVGGSGSDTIGDSVGLHGWNVTYTGFRR